MLPIKVRDPIVTERRSSVADKITFPFKDEYGRMNNTLENIKDADKLRDGPERLTIVEPMEKLRQISEGYAPYSEGKAGCD